MYGEGAGRPGFMFDFGGITFGMSNYSFELLMSAVFMSIAVVAISWAAVRLFRRR